MLDIWQLAPPFGEVPEIRFIEAGLGAGNRSSPVRSFPVPLLPSVAERGIPQHGTEAAWGGSEC